MTETERPEIQFEKKRQRRTRVVKVSLSEDEYCLLDEQNPFKPLAKLFRESALKMVKQQEFKMQHFSKIDREFLLELSRIGSNLNQVSKAINIDLARREPFDSVKLLHLLIGIDETVKSLKESVCDDC